MGYIANQMLWDAEILLDCVRRDPLKNIVFQNPRGEIYIYLLPDPTV